MIEDVELTTELELQTIEEKDGKFYFVAKSLSKDFECEDSRKLLSKKSVGKDYVWRHKHPVDKANVDTHVYGIVADSWLEDGEIFSKYQLYDHTQDHKDMIDLVKERHKANEPLGVSMRYRKYLENGVPIHYDVFEHSGTPYPKCQTCKTIEMGVIEMANEKEESKKDEKVFEDTLKKIKDLEDRLNSKTDIVKELKTKTEALEKEMEKKDKALEDKSKVEKTLEENITDMKNEIEYLKKKPILDKILEVHKLDEAELGFYKMQSVKYLEEKYEQFKKEAVNTKVIATQTQAESEDEANEANDEELSKKEPSFKEFTKLLNLKEKKED